MASSSDAHDPGAAPPGTAPGAAPAGDVTIVRGAHVLTMGPLGDIRHGAVALCGVAGTILDVGEAGAVLAAFPGARVAGDVAGIVLPGLVNAHDHLSEGLISGLGETMGLYEWQRRLIGPVGPVMNREYARAGAALKGAEMALSGITCVNDMFVHANPGSMASLGSVDGLEEVGLRSVVSYGAHNRRVPVPDDGIMAEHEALAQRCAGSALASFRMGIAALHAQTDSLLAASVRACGQHGWAVHTHLAEVREEITEARLEYGTNTLGRAREAGVADLETIYAHCVWLTEPDISVLAAHPAAVAHNPLSNMILGSGVCPVPRLRAAGVPVGLGTDGAASNDSHDMLQVLKCAALLQKLEYLDPAVLSARDVLTMGTIEGARALGLDHKIGSLEPGKCADIIQLTGNSIRLAYIHDPYQQLVYGAGPEDVANVWVNGKHIVRDRELTTVREPDVITQARLLAGELFRKAGLEDVVRRDRSVPANA